MKEEGRACEETWAPKVAPAERAEGGGCGAQCGAGDFGYVLPFGFFDWLNCEK